MLECGGPWHGPPDLQASTNCWSPKVLKAGFRRSRLVGEPKFEKMGVAIWHTWTLLHQIPFTFGWVGPQSHWNLVGKWPTCKFSQSNLTTYILQSRAHDHDTHSSTLLGGQGGAGPSSLHTTLEGSTEYVKARWMKSLRNMWPGPQQGHWSWKNEIIVRSGELSIANELGYHC